MKKFKIYAKVAACSTVNISSESKAEALDLAKNLVANIHSLDRDAVTILAWEEIESEPMSDCDTDADKIAEALIEQLEQILESRGVSCTE